MIKNNMIIYLEQEVKEKTEKIRVLKCAHSDSVKANGSGGECIVCEKTLNKFYFVCCECNSHLCKECSS